MLVQEGSLREATLRRLRRRWPTQSGALVIEELGTHFGASRIDIAVVDLGLHGYELKSDLDNLSRLPKQIDAFNEVFDYTSIVLTQRHLAEAFLLVPDSWGILIAEPTPRSVALRSWRRPALNREVEPLHVAGLLWRDELAEQLASMGASERLSSATRLELMHRLIQEAQGAELREIVSSRLRGRRGWRGGPTPLPDGEISPNANTSSRFLDRRRR
ncbi:sce7726 family protein [Modestobacter roseus]|uniref:sce7726 family protein n=1 Tax=Modestobacter roseus TaxID=1181884 RepID=UPI00141323CB